VTWSENFIQQPHEIFGGFPACPFATLETLFVIHPDPTHGGRS
jgi:hypothetical protein